MSQAFLTVLTMSEVVEQLKKLPVLRAEVRSLADADGHVLATDVVSPEDLPAANRSGMDGYAVIAADLLGASESSPAWLDLAGSIAIDQPANQALHSGQCMGIVTGGHLPHGADAVVMVEHTEVFGEGVIEIRRSAAPGDHVMLRGDDARKGHTVLRAGTLLRPQEIGLLAALGITSVAVYPKANVTIISTGDELVPIEHSPKPGQIRDVNSLALAAMVQRTGCQVTSLGIVSDDLASLTQVLREACEQTNGANVVFLSGGSSVGVRDLTVAALNALGNATLFCHGVAISPGKPLILARVGTTCVWGLPGQVTSAQVVMQILGLPFLKHLAGNPNAFDLRQWRSQRAILTRNTTSKQGREDYVRIRLEPATESTPYPNAVPVLGLSGLLRTLLESHGVMRIPAGLEGVEAGSEVDVILFEQG